MSTSCLDTSVHADYMHTHAYAQAFLDPRLGNLSSCRELFSASRATPVEAPRPLGATTHTMPCTCTRTHMHTHAYTMPCRHTCMHMHWQAHEQVNRCSEMLAPSRHGPWNRCSHGGGNHTTMHVPAGAPSKTFNMVAPRGWWVIPWASHGMGIIR
jgi:hypothetical protein